MPQKTLNEEVLVTRKTLRRDSEYQSPSGEFQTFKQDDKGHLTSHGESEKNLKTDK